MRTVKVLTVRQPWAISDSKFHWLVSNAKPIQPIPARGSLGLWNYELTEDKKAGE